MSIAQQIMANPGRYSIQQLQSALNEGIVPAYIAIPLIEQKTKEAAAFKIAELAANAPQEGSKTIAEQVLAQADQGLDQLPSNLPVEGYAPGGIVAFADKGLVQDEDKEEEFDATPEGLMKLFRSTLPTQTPEEQLKAGVSAIRGMRTTGDDVTDDIKKYIQQQQNTAAERARNARANRWVELGANILASKDRYATGAIGEGLVKTMPGFISDEKAAEEEGLKYLQIRNELEKQRRAEESADITGGISLYGHTGTENARRSAAAARMAGAFSKLTQGQTPKGFDNLVKAKFDQYMVQIRKGLRPAPMGADNKPLEGADLEDFVRGQAAADAASTWREFGPMMAYQGTQAGITSREGIEALQRDAALNTQLSSVTSRIADDVRADSQNRSEPLFREIKDIRQKHGSQAANIRLENERRSRFNNDPSVPANRKVPLLPEPWNTSAPATPATAKDPAAPPKTTPKIADIQNAPAGSTIGQLVPGKGWEIKGPGGKLLGYAK